MASIPVMYTLLWLVMDSCVSESREEKPHIIKLVPNSYRTGTYPTPQNISSTLVKEGHDISFRCSAGWVRDAEVRWFRMNYRDYVAYINYRNDVCSGKSVDQLLVNLHVGNTSCRDGSYELQIRNIDHKYEGGWYCLVTDVNNNERWRSGYIDLKVDSHNEESTSRRTRPPTTSILQTTVSRHEASSSNPTEAVSSHVASSSNPTEAVSRHEASSSNPTEAVSSHVGSSSNPTEAATEYTTERTDNESPSRNTLVPLIGGGAGGVIVLLVLVITGCALYRSKRGSNHPDDGQACTYPNRQPGNAEAVGMEGNPFYISSGAGNDDYAQIDCRESASPSHEKGETSMLKTQPNSDDCQAGPDIGDIYAIPDKSKTSAAEEKGEVSEVKNQPNLDDRNLNQPGLDSGETYAVPDKSKKTAAEDVEDVYSQVQKPKK